MRLHVLSDLHTEMAPFSPPATAADVVVLAGDIGVKLQGLQWAAQAFPTTPVIYVAGNHEYYGAALPHLTHKLRAAAPAHVRFLEEDVAVVGHVRFLGVTLWTDFALFGAGRRDECIEMARARMTDFKRIRKSPQFRKLTPHDAMLLHARGRAWLRTRLDEKHDGPTVIVTHHAPLPPPSTPAHATDLLSAAYASDVGDLLDGRAALWVFGHTHEHVDVVVRGTRVVSNQRGYPDEPADGFDPGFVVDLP